MAAVWVKKSKCRLDEAHMMMTERRFARNKKGRKGRQSRERQRERVKVRDEENEKVTQRGMANKTKKVSDTCCCR